MSTDKKNKFKSVATKLCAAGLTILVAGLGYRYAMPKTYQALAKVEILKSGLGASGDTSFSFGLEKLPGECQIARSDAILDRVITNLDLKALWGKRLNQGPPLTTEKAREQLRELLNVQPAPNAAIMEIVATGGDPVELAEIVNEIARLYCDFRRSGREEASHQGIDSLRAKWEAQNQKVQDAQAAVDKLAHDFNLDRATNSVQVYDAKAWESLRSQHAEMAEDYRKKSNQLAQLKSLERGDLLKVLSTNDTGTNSVLAGTRQQLDQAKSVLHNAQTAHGADARETKSAELVVDQLNHRIDGLLASAISTRELELASIKATLEQINGMADKARNATNDLKRLQAQETTFAKAKDNLDTLVAERDRMEQEIISSGSGAAVMPNVITARIMELADPPVKPVSPDGEIALEVLAVGGIVMGAGLLLLVLLGLKPRGAEKKAA